jgi:multidrug efflux pump subunit AcrA (membrane-fusion protein)
MFVHRYFRSRPAAANTRPPNRPGAVRHAVGRLLAAAAVAAMAGPAAGCKKSEAAFAEPPPPEVTVARPIVRTLPTTAVYTGTTRARESVQVRARVQGVIDKRHVEGGLRVKAGDLLFTIDPLQFDAAVRQAKAELTEREANLSLATTTLSKVSQAAKESAASKFELDQATANRDIAAAQVETLKARVQRAELDLGYTQVRAPCPGG